jgi:hypothetical protein
VHREPNRCWRHPSRRARFQVWEGEVDFEITIFANSALGQGEPESDLSEVELGVEVRYQACDDVQCFAPKTRHLSLTVPTAKVFAPSFDSMKGMGATTIEMDTMAHFKVLNARQIARNDQENSGGDSAD